MKRAFYIFCFTMLGVLLQFLAHAILEMGVLALLLKDFDRYGLGLTWSQWYSIHAVLTLLLLILGITFGYRWGVKWWQVLYVEKRYGWPPKWKK